MSVSSRLIELFEAGYKPAEVVRMGYPKSTVYAVYRRWMEGKIGKDFIYIAHDADYIIVKKLSDQLNLLGYKTVIGGNTEDTLALIKPARVVVGIVSEKPGVRRQLLFEELYTASKLTKPTYIFAEKGSKLPRYNYNYIKIIELDKNTPERTVRLLVTEMRGKKNDLGDLIAAIIISVLVALGIVAIAKLLEELFFEK
ncbi:MAG: hypothetical protein GSR85_11495 [Desulfurococcales archaeon]|nr:hypothetical protein [Desulfurococcales archaeon]